ncbi:MAG: ATP-binding protein [Streptosporangiaceae bacterium]
MSESPVPLGDRDDYEGGVAPVPQAYLEPITDDSRLDLPDPDAVGRTMFDAPGAEDGSVTVLLPKEEIRKVPLQSLVRIASREDGRAYLGIVVSGPFAEPDGLRADANVIVTTSVRGGIFMPRYHGRVRVEILGEEKGGRLVPPRFRPLPNSPVRILEVEDRARALQAYGDLRIGTVLGDDDVQVGIPSTSKAVLPRHLAVLGTTGGGKSTTIGTLVSQAGRADMAVVLLDTEGEYVHLGEPTDAAAMIEALSGQGMAPAGVPNTRLYHLVGTETANPGHPARTTFGLSFEQLSPYAVAEIVDMSDPQQERFMKAVDVGKQVLRDLKIFPRTDEDERRILELNEFEEGYPDLTLSRLMDIVRAFLAHVEKAPDTFQPFNPEFREPRAREAILRRVANAQSHTPVSWRSLLGRLWRLHRLRIFDQPKNPPLTYAELLGRGKVSIIDLSDTDSPQLNNIVIADMLRGIQRTQDEAYQKWERGSRGVEPVRVMLIIEEAHEFLSAGRITKMPVLFEQVSRIAKRGRKRWLGLVFVTQLPQHLPREVLGLVNNHVLHKITDEGVIRGLRGTIPGIDEGLWRRLPALAPGQAVVSFTHMTRPLLVSVDPSPCRLRMID